MLFRRPPLAVRLDMMGNPQPKTARSIIRIAIRPKSSTFGKGRGYLTEGADDQDKEQCKHMCWHIIPAPISGTTFWFLLLGATVGLAITPLELGQEQVRGYIRP
jgi:hypothetical protein